MRPTRRLASSHGILRFQGVQEEILLLLKQLAPVDFLGYPPEFEKKAAGLLREIAITALREAWDIEDGRAE